MAEKIANTGIAGTEVVRVEGSTVTVDPERAFCTICVSHFQATTKPENLIAHFRDEKNGGGDIDKVIFTEAAEGEAEAAVITFVNPEGKVFMADWLTRTMKKLTLYLL